MTEGNRYTERERVLDGAKKAVMQERNATYGPPTQDFDRTAAKMNADGYSGPGGRPIESHDVAIFAIYIKTSRLAHSPDHQDSWVDTAGYAACGYECAVHEASEKEQVKPEPRELSISELANLPLLSVVDVKNRATGSTGTYTKLFAGRFVRWVSGVSRLTSGELSRMFYVTLPD